MKLSDFDFDLPEALIATRPARPRTAARLLLAEGDSIRDLHVSDLVDIFRPGDRLVLNNTRVIPARLFGTRQRGEAVAKVEITLLEPQAAGLARPGQTPAQGAGGRGDPVFRSAFGRRGRQIRNRPAAGLQPDGR